MSGISKDFEEFAKTRGMPLSKIINNLGETVYKNWCVQDAFEAFKAGRAYDIEGLISKVLSEKWDESTPYYSGLNCGLEAAANIIRKHFGKE